MLITGGGGGEGGDLTKHTRPKQLEGVQITMEVFKATSLQAFIIGEGGGGAHLQHDLTFSPCILSVGKKEALRY